MKNYKSIIFSFIFWLSIGLIFLLLFKMEPSKDVLNKGKTPRLLTWSTKNVETSIIEGITASGVVEAKTWSGTFEKKHLSNCNEYISVPYSDIDTYTIEKDLFIKYFYFKWLAHLDYDFLKRYDNKEKDSYETDYLFQKSLKDKDCSSLKWSVKDNFAVCEIYVSWDLNRLNNFKFSDWESWSGLITFFDKLNTGKVSDDYTLNTIYNFYDFEKNIKIDFTQANFWSREYIYLKAKGKDKFLEELNSQFLLECEKIK